MHKAHPPDGIPPFRPIISSIGAYNYDLAKHLGRLLAPHILSEICTQDSLTIVNEIKELSPNGTFLLSFDVERLFTNIPRDESRDLAVEYIIDGNPSIKPTNSELKQLFLLATSRTHFLFKGHFYDQVDDIAMGSPLAPLLANLFIGHHEKSWISNFDNSQLLFYSRYKDDTFCVFNGESDAMDFFEYINSKHPNIWFTMEKEMEMKLPFIDVLLDNSQEQVITKVY